ncbi:MAG: uracil-DNA glycosylase [Gammaproteobacteria bacterium]
MQNSPHSQALSARQRALLGEMGIDVWETRSVSVSPEPEAVDVVADQETETVDSLSIESLSVDTLPVDPAPLAEEKIYRAATGNWAELNETIRACTQCELHANRKQAVCGVGSTVADWLVIGEAPGADEDAQGEPFVGRAGQLLNQMLLAAGQPREKVFIANILKCRPPNNRDPKPAEVEKCLPYLQSQIDMVQPKLILVVGRIAAHNLLNVETPIGKLRGKVHAYGKQNIPVVVTYHPAYLLRSPAQKRKSWDDLLLAMDVATGKVR